MRRIALVMVAVAAAALVLSGCGTKVPGVPNTVATVNGQPISAADYLGQISRRVGQDVLTNMIEQKIVIQWAKDENVPVTEEQVKKQIDILKRDGIYEDQVKFMGEDGLKSEITAMQARVNVAKKMVKIPESELQSIYDSMKDRYVHGPRKQVALVINSDKNKVEEAEKKIEAGKDFDSVAGQFTDRRFMMRGIIKLWVSENQPGMPPPLAEAAKNTSVGKTSKMFTISQPSQPNQYVILKVLREQPKADLKPADVKDELENAAAMQKSQMDVDFQKALNNKKKEAKIEVGIAEFKDIVQSFKNPPEPAPSMMGPPQRMPSPKKK